MDGKCENNCARKFSEAVDDDDSPPPPDRPAEGSPKRSRSVHHTLRDLEHVVLHVLVFGFSGLKPPQFQQNWSLHEVHLW